MRDLIDRKKLLADFDIGENALIPNRSIHNVIERQPTVDSVKHGHWAEYGNGVYYCSECQEEAYWDTDYGQQLFKYCPYCGALMQEGKE